MKKKKCDIKKLKTLGKLLRSEREKISMPLRDVAKICKISFGALSKLERAETPRPPIDLLQRLAVLYDIEADNLIILAEKIPPDVYWKIVSNPSLVKTIRNIEV